VECVGEHYCFPIVNRYRNLLICRKLREKKIGNIERLTNNQEEAPSSSVVKDPSLVRTGHHISFWILSRLHLDLCL
jgi:hypothetical protein